MVFVEVGAGLLNRVDQSDWVTMSTTTITMVPPAVTSAADCPICLPFVKWRYWTIQPLLQYALERSFSCFNSPVMKVGDMIFVDTQ